MPVIESAAIAEIIKLLLSITDKILDRMPDYDQRKKTEFYWLKKRYEDEIAKEYPYRDDNLCGIYRRDLMLFLSVFNSEISGENVPPMHRPTDEGSKASN